jgi:hypothetical protein
VIASTNVARWTWGRDDDSADALMCCLHDLLAAHRVLSAHRFAVDGHTVRVSVTEAGDAKSYLFKGEFTVPGDASSLAEAVAQLVDQVRAGLRAGEIGSVDAFVECSGVVAVNADEEEARQGRLFLLGASSFADYVTADLVTHTDVWLPHGHRPQPQRAVGWYGDWGVATARTRSRTASVRQQGFLGAERQSGQPALRGFRRQARESR